MAASTAPISKPSLPPQSQPIGWPAGSGEQVNRRPKLRAFTRTRRTDGGGWIGQIAAFTRRQSKTARIHSENGKKRGCI
jgi:hypothetical protein